MNDVAPARLNQPWRGFVAAGEILLAAVAVVLGVLSWGRGIAHMVTPLADGKPPLVTTIFHGDWMSGAIGLVTLAAILVLDAIRQAVLAVRTRRRPPPPEVTVAPPSTAASG